MKISYLFIFLALVAADDFDLYLHQDSAAKCLDGSPAAFYFHRGQIADKFVLHFEGGGLCRGDGLQQTLQDCYKRSFSNLGSSKDYPQTKNFDVHTYLSSDPAYNPFYNWNRVFVPYCDGSLHQGSRKEPVAFKDRSLYFRGSNNTIATLQFLGRHFNASKASQMVITGGSAGGAAAYLWSNFIYDKVEHPEGVTIVPDSGIFIGDFPNMYNNKTMFDHTQELIKLTNEETMMPVHECVRKYPTQKECFSVGFLAQFIKPKVFIVQSQYDAWGLHNILQLKCIPGGSPASMEKCNDTEKAYVERYRAKINEAVANFTAIERNGAWSVACIQHVFATPKCTKSDNYKIPSDTGTQITDALVNFMKGKQRLYVDSVAWPNNKGCNGMGRVPPSLTTE